jgi:hypothetical protein
MHGGVGPPEQLHDASTELRAQWLFFLFGL